jgi:hypothetical protein
VAGTTAAAAAGSSRVQPFALTYPQGGYPTDKPRPQLQFDNLPGYTHGFPPILNYSTIDENQLWGSAMVTGSTVAGTTAAAAAGSSRVQPFALTYPQGGYPTDNRVISPTSNSGKVILIVVAALAILLGWSRSLLGPFPAKCRQVTATGMA